MESITVQKHRYTMERNCVKIGLYESKLRECLERACRSVDGETEMMRENDCEKDHDDRNQGQRENTSKRKVM